MQRETAEKIKNLLDDIQGSLVKKIEYYEKKGARDNPILAGVYDFAEGQLYECNYLRDKILDILGEEVDLE